MDKRLYAGDYQIDQLTLISLASKNQIDIGQYVQELTLYESVFTQGITGRLMLVEPLSILEDLPISGNEVLEITFSDPAQQYVFKKVLVVTKIENMKNDRNTTGMSMYLSSRIFLENRKHLLSMSYNQPGAEIVESIVKKTMALEDSLIVEPTKYDRQVVFPGYRPLEAIRYIANTSISATAKNDLAGGYLFFEDKNGFNLVTVQWLKENRPKHPIKKYSAKENIRRTDDNNVREDLFNTVYNVYDMIDNGIHACTIHKHDIINKTIDQEIFYRQNGDNICMGAEHTRYSDAKHYYTSVNYDRENIAAVLKMRGHNSRYDQLTYSAEIPGNLQINVGDIAVLYFPSFKTGLNDDNKQLPEEYLITYIKHVITNEGYQMFLELAADGVQRDS